MKSRANHENDADRRTAGFSLIEVMVAALIVVMVVPLLVALQIRVLKMNGEAAQMDIAVWAAEAKLEALTTADIATLFGGSEEIVLADGRKLLRTWKTDVDNPETGLTAVEVTVIDMSIDEAKPVTLWFVIGPQGS